MQISRSCWLRLWGHKNLLPRHKLNWWLFLSDCFPTIAKLSSIFSIEITDCPICSFGPETMTHLLFFCVFSRRWWLASPWNIRSNAIRCSSPLDCLNFLWSVEDRDKTGTLPRKNNRNITLFALVLLDCIWKYRNDIIHRGSVSNPQVLFESIYRSYSSLLAGWASPSSACASSWSPPPSDWVKINLDAAIAGSRGSIACVARGTDSSILDCCVKEIPALDPLVAECFALELAIDLACSCGWSAVIFEGDCKLVMDSLNSRSCNALWSISTLLENCLVKLSAIHFWTASFAPRDCNVLVHTLARWSCSFGSLSQSLFALPVFGRSTM
ncbi:hypothetical protein UlMin_034530 [Ulmus minor]